MEKNNTRSAKRWTTTDVTRMALVTGLYVAVTLVLSVFSFGVIQIRLSEMFNYLSLYNKRYIVAVTAGVALANIGFSSWTDRCCSRKRQHAACIAYQL